MLNRKKIVPLPLQGLALTAICALYLLTGLIGHDPWKGDDTLNFGVAYSLFRDGHWLLPQLAGERYLDTPPLYHWVAACGAKLLAGLLPPHDAIRLATGIFGASFLLLLTLACRQLQASAAAMRPVQAAIQSQPEESRLPANESGVAALIAIGSLGLLVPIHDTQPLIALLAASAATYAGCIMLLKRPLAGGMITGLGLGSGFLASGFTAMVTLLPLILLLPCNRHWRSANGLRGLACALLIGLLLGASWPALLACQEPEAFNAWWSLNSSNLRIQPRWLNNLPGLAQLLTWFAWPALPLAIWTLWFKRQHLNQPAIVLPLIGSITTLLSLALIFEPRPTQALPLLVPLILLAANSASQLRRGASNAFDWFGMMTFSIVAGLIWLGGLAMTTGIPAQIARNFAKLEPGFVAEFSPLAYLVALSANLIWLWLIFSTPRSPWRATTHWAAGMTLVWLLLTALWLPWIDYGKTYRHVMTSLDKALPIEFKNGARQSCIAGRNLGSTQRILLQYFTGIVTVPAQSRAAATCSLLIEQGAAEKETRPAGWRKLWEGHRPGDRSERLRLYLKPSAKNPQPADADA